MKPFSATFTEVLLTIAIVSIVLLMLALITKYLIYKIKRMFPNDDIMMDEEQYGKHKDDIDWY